MGEREVAHRQAEQSSSGSPPTAGRRAQLRQSARAAAGCGCSWAARRIRARAGAAVGGPTSSRAGQQQQQSNRLIQSLLFVLSTLKIVY
uniref:Uncharacterized protein n=1 Tax=Oryza meridionalis TaxID=40149 RepID=A0A0E0C6A9_9ORYZ